jgi:chromosome segregation ATPase
MEYYNSTKKAHAMSHGFTFPEEALKQGVYHEFNTFEISVLPPEAAANPYTSYQSIKEAKMNEKKRKYLEEVFGKEEAAKRIAEIERTNAATAKTAEFKQFADITGLEHEASSGEKGSESDTDATGIKALLADLIGDSAEIAEGQLNAGKAITALKTRLDKQDERIKALEDELAGTPEPASQSSETEFDNSDLENEAKGKEAGEKSGFWAPYTEEA